LPFGADDLMSRAIWALVTATLADELPVFRGQPQPGHRRRWPLLRTAQYDDSSTVLDLIVAVAQIGGEPSSAQRPCLRRW